MHPEVAGYTKAHKLEKELIAHVCIGQVVDMLDWFFRATLADASFALKNQPSQLAPLE